MLKREWQKISKNPWMIIILIAIITIPAIYTSVFLGSMWDPYGDADQLPVAVVNHDKKVNYEGSRGRIEEWRILYDHFHSRKFLKECNNING